MKRKNYLLFVFVYMLFNHAQAQPTFPKVLNQWINNYVLENIQEKLYVQTNTGEYTPGDTIWFKASLVNAVNHSPVGIEHLFYIDLLSPESKVVSHQVYFLNMGFSDGYLPLSNKLQTGQYKLIAYTNYMKNYPLDFIFQKPIKLVQPPMERSTWQFKSHVIPFAGGDSVFVSIVGQNMNGRDINETLNIRVQLAHGTVLGEDCPVTNNVGRFQFVVPNSLKIPQARLSLRHPNKSENSEQYTINLSIMKPDLQFLPEGGQLIAGIENQVAFKCIDQDGHPIAISGDLLDNNQQIVSHFSTEYEGMGSLNLTPEKGTHYSAQIDYRDSTFTYSLPEVESEAYGLHVIREDQDSIYISIRQDSSRVQDFILFGHTRGSAKFITTGTLTKNELKHGIPKSLFPTGITVLTLFINHTPVSERLVYIDKNDPVQFEIYHEKLSYGKRSMVNLDILATDTAGDPVQGNFSLLAYDSGLDRSIDSLENIRNYFLLSSDLHGQVASNTDVFDQSDPACQRKRDLLMLTNGWRRFNWSEIYHQFSQQKTYEMEQGIVVDGEIRRILTNKPVPKNFEISLVLRNKGLTHIDKTYTDEQGKFSFQLPLFTDSAQLTIQTKNRFGAQRDYFISLHSNLENLELSAISFDKIQQKGISPLVVNITAPKSKEKIRKSIPTPQQPKIKRPRIDNYYFPGKDTFLIQEVEVKSKYLNQRDSMLSQSGQPDVVIESAQLKKLTEEKAWYSNIWDLITNQVPGLRISQAPYQQIRAEKSNLVICDPRDKAEILSKLAQANAANDQWNSSLGNMTKFQIKMALGGPAIYFNVLDNPKGHLYIFVDHDFLNNSSVPLYDFLSYMDPSEIESINFIARPKNYDTTLPLGQDFAINTLSVINQNLENISQTENSFNLFNSQTLRSYILKDFEKSSYPPAFLFITTKSKGGIFAKRAKGIQSLYLSGLNAPRKFYTPRYPNTSESSEVTSDYRKTISWEPQLITDSTGFAHVSFYTNDSNNPINIQVEGVTAKGALGSTTFILPRKDDKNLPPAMEIVNNNAAPPMHNENPYRKLQLYFGYITDKETGHPLVFANLTQTSPYYHEASNNDGEFFLAKDRLKPGENITVSSPGYYSKTITIPNSLDKIIKVELEKTPTEQANNDVKMMQIIRTAIRKSNTYYASKESYQGYNREVIQINDETYGINESAFNYSNAGWAGNPNTIKFETVKFKRMEDKEGHKLMQLKPNHRSLFYPLKADVLSLSPDFWNLTSLNQFNYKLIGQLEYDGEMCYKIRFEQDDQLVLPLQQGILYIGKETSALRYAYWTTTPDKRKYISYTSYLQSNPMDYQTQVENDFNEVSYSFINGQLRLQATNQQIRILADQQDELIYKSRLSIVGQSARKFRNIQNDNSDMLIEDGKSTHMLVKDASYRITPWVNSGMIKPEEQLINDASFLHDITIYN